MSIRDSGVLSHKNVLIKRCPTAIRLFMKFALYDCGGRFWVVSFVHIISVSALEFLYIYCFFLCIYICFFFVGMIVKVFGLKFMYRNVSQFIKIL